MGYLTIRNFYIYKNIALNSSENEKCFRQNLYRHLQNKFMLNNIISENSVVDEVMLKNIVGYKHT